MNPGIKFRIKPPLCGEDDNDDDPPPPPLVLYFLLGLIAVSFFLFISMIDADAEMSKCRYERDYWTRQIFFTTTTTIFFC